MNDEIKSVELKAASLWGWVSSALAAGALLGGTGWQMTEDLRDPSGSASSVLVAQEEVRVAQEEVRRLHSIMSTMKPMTTTEIIERDIQKVIMSYGLVKILQTWSESRDAGERAALQELMDVRYDLTKGLISIDYVGTNLPPVAISPAISPAIVDPLK